MSQTTLDQQKQVIEDIELLRKKGDYHGALETIEAARDVLPLHQNLVLKHSQCLKQLDRQDDALRVVNEALYELPIAPLYKEKALLLVATGQMAEANDTLNSAPDDLKDKLAPIYDYVSRAIAIKDVEILRKEGDYHGALAAIEAARYALPVHQNLVLKHSQCLKQLDRQNDALQVVSEALEELPVAPLYKEKALLLVATGQTAEANDTLSAAPDTLKDALTPVHEDVSRITAIEDAEVLRRKLSNLESSVENQSFTSLFIKKVKGKVAWNVDQDIKSIRGQILELENSIEGRNQEF